MSRSSSFRTPRSSKLGRFASPTASSNSRKKKSVQSRSSRAMNGATSSSSATSGRQRIQAKLTADVKVSVRVRPLSPEEQKGDSMPVVLTEPSQKYVEVRNHKVMLPKRLPFKFDSVYGASQGHVDVFNESVQPALAEAMKGKFGLVAFYGQSGSGKGASFRAMLRESGYYMFEWVAQRNRVFEEQLQTLRDRGDSNATVSGFEYSVFLSRMEVYQGDIYDLLAGKGGRLAKLRLRPDAVVRKAQRGASKNRPTPLYVEDLTYCRLDSVEDYLKAVDAVGTMRKRFLQTAKTFPGRSHSLARISVVVTKSKYRLAPKGSGFDEQKDAVLAAASLPGSASRRQGRNSAQSRVHGDLQCLSRTEREGHVVLAELASTDKPAETLLGSQSPGMVGDKAARRGRERAQLEYRENNISLVCLSQVLRALHVQRVAATNQEEVNSTVGTPQFRQSRLTTLLQETLVPNSLLTTTTFPVGASDPQRPQVSYTLKYPECLVSLVVCVSPFSGDYGETESALLYAFKTQRSLRQVNRQGGFTGDNTDLRLFRDSKDTSKPRTSTSGVQVFGDEERKVEDSLVGSRTPNGGADPWLATPGSAAPISGAVAAAEDEAAGGGDNAMDLLFGSGVPSSPSLRQQSPASRKNASSGKTRARSRSKKRSSKKTKTQKSSQTASTTAHPGSLRNPAPPASARPGVSSMPPDMLNAIHSDGGHDQSVYDMVLEWKQSREADLEKYRRTNDQLVLRLSEKQALCQSLLEQQQKQDAAHTLELQRMQAQLGDYKTLTDDLTQRLQAKETEMRVFKDGMTLEDMQNARKQVSEMAQAVSAKELHILDLKRQVAHHQFQLESAAKMEADLKALVNQKQALYDSVVSDLNNSQTREQQQNSRLAQLQTERDGAVAEREKQAVQINDLKKDTARLITQLRETSEDLRAEREKSSQLTQVGDLLRQEVARSRQHASGQRELVAELARQKVTLATRLKEQQRIVQQMNDLHAQRVLNSDVGEQKDGATGGSTAQRVSVLEAMNSSLKVSNTSLQALVSSYLQTIRELLNEVARTEYEQSSDASSHDYQHGIPHFDRLLSAESSLAVQRAAKLILSTQAAREFAQAPSMGPAHSLPRSAPVGDATATATADVDLAQLEREASYHQQSPLIRERTAYPKTRRMAPTQVATPTNDSDSSDSSGESSDDGNGSSGPQFYTPRPAQASRSPPQSGYDQAFLASLGPETRRILRQQHLRQFYKSTGQSTAKPAPKKSVYSGGDPLLTGQASTSLPQSSPSAASPLRVPQNLAAINAGTHPYNTFDPYYLGNVVKASEAQAVASSPAAPSSGSGEAPTIPAPPQAEPPVSTPEVSVALPAMTDAGAVTAPVTNPPVEAKEAASAVQSSAKPDKRVADKPTGSKKVVAKKPAPAPEDEDPLDLGLDEDPLGGSLDDILKQINSMDAVGDTGSTQADTKPVNEADDAYDDLFGGGEPSIPEPTVQATEPKKEANPLDLDSDDGMDLDFGGGGDLDIDSLLATVGALDGTLNPLDDSDPPPDTPVIGGATSGDLEDASDSDELDLGGSAVDYLNF